MEHVPSYNASGYGGRGVVYTGGTQQRLMHLLYANLKVLRKRCDLPVEIWRSSSIDGTLSDTVVELFRQLQADIYDLDQVVPKYVRMEIGAHAYLLKHLAILSSSFEEIIFIDSDNIPVKNVTYLFDEPHYVRTGFLLWPDFWYLRKGPSELRKIFSLPQDEDKMLPDTRTVESGQLVIHKGKAWKALMLSTYIEIHKEFFEPLVSGEGPLRKYQKSGHNRNPVRT